MSGRNGPPEDGDQHPAGLWATLVIGLYAIAVVLTVRVRERLSRPLRRVRIDDADEGQGHYASVGFYGLMPCCAIQSTATTCRYS